MKEAKWYREEIANILAIVIEGEKTEQVIFRSYLKEKLGRILDEIGISVHPTLKPLVKEILRKEP